MSRSVRPKLRSPADRRDAGDLRKLLLVKRLVKEARIRPQSTPIVSGAAIPITVQDKGPFVSYPASPDDLRAVLARLPPGVSSGLAGIQLGLNEAPAAPGLALDPFVGRLKTELFRGVYSHDVLGTYDWTSSSIHLFGYVFDPGRADRQILELYLKLKALSTFVHELAHHEDISSRAGRRQWREDSTETRETYARAMQHRWTQEHVVPYLHEAYPEAVAALLRWTEEAAGISVPLEALAGDPSAAATTTTEAFFSVPLGFEKLLEAVAEGQSATATRVGFAKHLQYSQRYDEALAILERVLEQEPTQQKALAIQGEIFLQQDRIVEATAAADRLMVREDAGREAWAFIRDAARARADWRAVLAAARRFRELATTRVERYEDRENRGTMGRAWLELGDFERAETELAELRKDMQTRGDEWRAASLACLVSLYRGDFAAALAQSTKLLSAGVRSHELVAAHFEAACGVGQPEGAEPLSDETRRWLARWGYRRWVTRLDALRG